MIFLLSITTFDLVKKILYMEKLGIKKILATSYFRFHYRRRLGA